MSETAAAAPMVAVLLPSIMMVQRAWQRMVGLRLPMRVVSSRDFTPNTVYKTPADVAHACYVRKIMAKFGTEQVRQFTSKMCKARDNHGLN
jgi:hypothetical protein